jgi:membrane protein
LSRVQDENQNTFRLLPARDSAHISLRNVVAAIDTIDENPRFTEQHPSLANLSACLDAFESRKDLGMADTLLRDIEPTKCAESAPNESS